MNVLSFLTYIFFSFFTFVPHTAIILSYFVSYQSHPSNFPHFFHLLTILSNISSGKSSSPLHPETCGETTSTPATLYGQVRRLFISQQKNFCAGGRKYKHLIVSPTSSPFAFATTSFPFGYRLFHHSYFVPSSGATAPISSTTLVSSFPLPTLSLPG